MFFARGVAIIDGSFVAAGDIEQAIRSVCLVLEVASHHHSISNRQQSGLLAFRSLNPTNFCTEQTESTCLHHHVLHKTEV